MATNNKIDWSWGPGHGPIAGVVNAAGATLATTMVADLAGAAPWYPALGGVLAASGAAASALVKDTPGSAICYRAACWLGAGIWSAGTLAFSSPWHTGPLASLGIGAVTAATFGAGFARAERRAAAAIAAAEAAAARRAPADARERKAVEWETRIDRVCGVKGVQVLGIAEWETGAGFTLDVLLPLGGTTWRTLKDSEEGLASDARLPEGCGCEVTKGADRRSALVYVSTRNALLEELNYPTDCSNDTVNNPRVFGRFRDATLTQASTRQDCSLFIGQTGSGKTNLMNVSIAEHLKCVDVVNLVIDFNGGGLALPWLLAWRQQPDRCPRPPIDWVATTPAEALLMTDWLLRVAIDRKSSYAHLKVAANETLLPVSPELPMFMLFIDEVAEILGEDVTDPITRKVGANVAEIIRIGRDSGVRTTIAGLAATNDVIGSRQNRVHSRIRSAMRGQDVAEMAYLFDTYKIDPELAPLPGTGFWQLGKESPRPYQVPHLRPNQTAEITVATTGRRPGPDARALQLGGRAWGERWERASELLAVLDAGAEAVNAIVNGEVPAAVVTAARPAPARRGGTGTLTGDDRVGEPVDLRQALADMEAARKRMNAAAAAAEAGTPADCSGEPDLGQSLTDMEAARQRMNAAAAAAEAAGTDPDAEIAGADWALVESWLADGTPATTEAGEAKPHPRLRMRQLIQAAGEQGVGPTALTNQLQTEGYTSTYQTVSKWLKDDVTAGILAQPGGDRTPYVCGPQFDNKGGTL